MRDLNAQAQQVRTAKSSKIRANAHHLSLVGELKHFVLEAEYNSDLKEEYLQEFLKLRNRMRHAVEDKHKTQQQYEQLRYEYLLEASRIARQEIR